MPRDPRLEEYARLLVEECVDVQPGWQVLVRSQPLGEPLVEEVCRAIARRGAYALERITFTMVGSPAWISEAPEELLREVPSIERYAIENCDCVVGIVAPANTREAADIAPERLQMLQAAARPLNEPFMAKEKPWVGCQYPTPALAQDAGMSLAAFEDFLYGAVLIDWAKLETEMERIKERFDKASEVRIVGHETDVTFSLDGRDGFVSGRGANMPSGEVFYSPVEDSAEGVVTFSEYPGVYLGREVRGIRLRFQQGRVVEASAESEQDFLEATLDTDEGARALGEFGIGCNPGIQRHLKNTLFDEKIEGTVHLALGKGWPFLGGTNESAIHWDIVKDLRDGGSLYADGELVQQDGRWRL